MSGPSLHPWAYAEIATGDEAEASVARRQGTNTVISADSIQATSDPERAEPVAIRLLYLVPEQWPAFRTDVSVLFGKALPTLGLTTDLVAERSETIEQWPGGSAYLYQLSRRKALLYPAKLWHVVKALTTLHPAQHDAIQVRDMPIVALLALAAARWRRVPFTYWMSFHTSELRSIEARAASCGTFGRWFQLLHGYVDTWLLYRVVLHHARHVFVQSDRMREVLVERGVDAAKMTAVPMGVDVDAADPSIVRPVDDPRLIGKRVVIYLGTLDRERQIELILEALALSLKHLKDLVLVLAGDTEDFDYRESLTRKAAALGLTDSIIWTGWLPTREAWRYVRASELGLSPLPRGFLFDSSSPTKLIEYMALGVPVIASDVPDQEYVIRESGAGLCIDLTAPNLSTAMVKLLADPRARRQMSIRGRVYACQARDYRRIAVQVRHVYQELLSRKRAS